MANAVSIQGEGSGLSLLDIVNPESAAALKDLIDNSPGHSYIKPDLSDINLLKVSIIDGNDDSVISHVELATNANAAVYQRALTFSQTLNNPDHQPLSINNSIQPITMDPNLVAQLLANDPQTSTPQPSGPPLQQPSNNALQPQDNPLLQSPPPAPPSPTPSTTNQLSPPRQNKYNNIYNPNQNGPRYYSDDSDSDSEEDNNLSPFSFPGISINNNNGNNYGPINTGINTSIMTGGWPNGNTVFINGQDWSGIPQSQWPASVEGLSKGNGGGGEGDGGGSEGDE